MKPKRFFTVPEQVNQWLRQAMPNVRRPRWDVGVIVAVALFCIFLLRHAFSPGQQVVSMVVDLIFVQPDGGSQSMRQYATNSYGLEAIGTEAALLCSELILLKAEARLDKDGELERKSFRPFPRAHQSARSGSRFPEWRFASRGIRLQAVGKAGAETAQLLNEIVAVYQAERKDLLPAPPGCSEVQAKVLRSAAPSARFANLELLLPFTASAGLLGLAAALFGFRRPKEVELGLVSMFIAWMSLLFGLGIWIRSLDWVVMFAGAILGSSLITGAWSCIALTASNKPAVAPWLLKVTFVVSSIGCLGFGWLEKMVSPTWLLDSGRVLVGIVNPAGSQLLPETYNPRFIETECELIQMSAITGGLFKEPHFQRRLSHFHSFGLNRREAEERVRRRLSAKPVKGTGLIEISFYDEESYDDVPDKVRSIASAYRSYWERRSQTNDSTRVGVTLLNSARSPEKFSQFTRAQEGRAITDRLLSALYVLGGALCVAWLAKKPRMLWCFPAVVSAYLLIMGVLLIASTLAPEVYAAACQVRISPLKNATYQGAGSRSRSLTDAQVARECEMAISDRVLRDMLESLDANDDFKRTHREVWLNRGDADKLAWLRQQVRVVMAENTFLLCFVAESDSPRFAAEIANLAGKSYCKFSALLPHSNDSASGHWVAEIVDPATPPLRPSRNSLPLLDCLSAGFGCLLLLSVGATIAYVGMLIQRARRNRESAHV